MLLQDPSQAAELEKTNHALGLAVVTDVCHLSLVLINIYLGISVHTNDDAKIIYFSVMAVICSFFASISRQLAATIPKSTEQL